LFDTRGEQTQLMGRSGARCDGERRSSRQTPDGRRSENRNPVSHPTYERLEDIYPLRLENSNSTGEGTNRKKQPRTGRPAAAGWAVSSRDCSG